MLRRIVPVRVSDHAVQQLMFLIETGQLQPGDRLPVEREIASQLGVSRPTVREALRVLEAMGLVEIRRGRGIYAVRRDGGAGGLQDNWRKWVVDHRSELVEVWQVRAALEAEASAMAAQRATPGELDVLRRIHKEMGDAIAAGDLTAIILTDYQFHSHIAQVSGNRVLRQLVESALSPSDDRNRPRVFSLPGRQERSWQEHGEVLAAIEATDPAEAAAAMRRHLRGVIRDVEALADQLETAPAGAERAETR
jgi:GntR family transcriptional repressor for pyruvate dehydrogenase complex